MLQARLGCCRSGAMRWAGASPAPRRSISVVGEVGRVATRRSGPGGAPQLADRLRDARLHAGKKVGQRKEGRRIATRRRRQQEHLLRLGVVETQRLQHDRQRLAGGVVEACRDEAGVDIETVRDRCDQLIDVSAAGVSDDLGGTEDRAKRAVEPAGGAAVAPRQRAGGIVGKHAQPLRPVEAQEVGRIAIMRRWRRARPQRRHRRRLLVGRHFHVPGGQRRGCLVGQTCQYLRDRRSDAAPA